MNVQQLPLSLKLRDDALFENFFVGKNDQVVTSLQSFVSNQSDSFIYCYGEQGVGKTHLLQSCCHLMNSVFYFSLENAAEYSPKMVEALEEYHCVCIDDIDTVIGHREWEEALFHFYNRARENQTLLLVSAKVPPQQLHCVLPDLKSRLQWGLTLEVQGLLDAEKMQALQLRAQLRGLLLTDEVATYLLHHYSRNMRDLFFVLEKLDLASLAAKRKITIPFVKSIIEKK